MKKRKHLVKGFDIFKISMPTWEEEKDDLPLLASTMTSCHQPHFQMLILTISNFRIFWINYCLKFRRRILWDSEITNSHQSKQKGIGNGLCQGRGHTILSISTFIPRGLGSERYRGWFSGSTVHYPRERRVLLFENFVDNASSQMFNDRPPPEWHFADDVMRQGSDFDSDSVIIVVIRPAMT